MDSLLEEHARLTRRFFLQALSAAGGSALLPAFARGQAPAMAYLTVQEMFGTVERGRPLPYTLPPDELAAAGLTRDTWRLEVVCDPEHPPRLARELRGATAFTFAALQEMADRRAVRFLKTLTCANGVSPLGTGLWEGVPLRYVLFRTGLRSHCRRIFYHGFHNRDPRQIFRSSLPLDRVYEDPPGTPPIILAYKLNGEWLSGKRGGPVRLIVPESYGFKSVKWLSRIILSNRSTSNDTYAQYNNTTESWMKTFARFATRPERIRAGEPIPLSGVAQVGTSGLRHVQYWIVPGEPEPAEREPFFLDAPWSTAEILGPPTDWGGRLPATDNPSNGSPRALGFNADGPAEWPMRFAVAHWAAVAPPQRPGRYTVFCRTVDDNRVAQPWPRPLQNSGRNLLDRFVLEVT
ncbi:MAG: molybdopterin-dependent oxidoreductase [Myxococcota bacterium]